jgi:hypothetical protein
LDSEGQHDEVEAQAAQRELFQIDAH